MVWVDNAKIFSSLAVITLHVSSIVVLGVDETNNSVWWAGNIYESFSRWCVPVFVMVSGLLLLDPSKKESLGVYYKKRFSKVGVPVLFWTLFYLGWFFIARLIQQDSVTVAVLIKKAFSGEAYYHLWYLYMLIGLYLIAPFLRKLAGVASFKELLLLCIIMFFLSITQNIANHFTSCDNTLFYNWFILYLPYFVGGYIINCMDLNRYKRLIIPVFLGSVLVTSLGNYYWSHNTNNGLYFYSYTSINVVAMSISVFILFKIFIRKVSWKNFSKLFFGIYLIHPIFIDILKFFGITPLLFHPIISIPIISLVVFALSIFLTKMILKTPYLQRIV